MQAEQVIQGRRLAQADVSHIRQWLAEHPGANRTQLSRHLCLLWDWRNPAGQVKDMACRTLLLKLEALGQIQLPKRRTASVNAYRNRTVPEMAHEQSPVQGSLSGLRPLQLQWLNGPSPELDLFRFFLQRYHYLGHRNCVGENLKYLARDRSGRPLACLLFGSAAWKLAPRDAWIGWNSEQRAQHLSLVTNNTRFLILPWVRVRQLASHLLAQVTARLAADWRLKYGHGIELVETFIEPERFEGTCYRAAGWIEVGATTGRSRNHSHPAPKGPIKEVYLKALSPNGRRKLAS